MFTLNLLVTVPLVAGVFNEALDFIIGDNIPSGAILLTEDTSQVDLAKDCGKSDCPSVIIFASQQWGTINMINCKKGRSYTFINKSKVDLGIVVQQEGGRFGSKPIGRFDVATCFCIPMTEDNETEPTNALLCRCLD